MSELERYRPLARAIARGFYLPGSDRDDIEQEAMLGVLKALRDHRPDAGLSLPNFVRLCVTRHLMTVVRLGNALKHGPLNESLRERQDEHGGVVDPLDLVPDRDADPLEILIRRERLAEVLEVVAHGLSPTERSALIGYANGLSYQEIGPRKAIDNALTRARRKLADPPTIAAAAA